MKYFIDFILNFIKMAKDFVVLFKDRFCCFLLGYHFQIIAVFFGQSSDVEMRKQSKIIQN